MGFDLLASCSCMRRQKTRDALLRGTRKSMEEALRRLGHSGQPGTIRNYDEYIASRVADHVGWLELTARLCTLLKRQFTRIKNRRLVSGFIIKIIGRVFHKFPNH